MVGRPGFPLYSVSFSPDGQSVISGSNDGTVRLWNVLTRQQVAVMSGDENPVLSVASAHHHSWMVSGDTGGSVRFWDSVAHQPSVCRHRATTTGFPPWRSTPTTQGCCPGAGMKTCNCSLRQTDVTEALCAKLGGSMSHAQWREWVSPWIPYVKTCPNLPVL